LNRASQENKVRWRQTLVLLQALAALLAIKISNRFASFSDIGFEHGG